MLGDRPSSEPPYQGQRALVRALTASSAVTAVGISPDGVTIAAGCETGAVLAWNVDTGLPIGTLAGHSASVTFAAPSHDSSSIITASRDGTIRIRDLIAASDRVIVVGPPILFMTVDASTTLALTATGDQTLQLWDLVSGRHVAHVGAHRGNVTCLASTPDFRLAISGDDTNELHVWDLTTRQLAHRLEAAVTMHAATISRDGRRAVTGTRRAPLLRVWDLQTRSSAASLPAAATSSLCHASTASGDDVLVAGCVDATMRIWGLDQTPRPTVVARHPGSVSAVAAATETMRVVSAALDSVAVWNLDVLRLPDQRELRADSGIRPGIDFGTTNSSVAIKTESPLAREPGREAAYENVQFSVYRPSAICPDEWYPMLAFAHLAEARPGDSERDPVARVEREARQVLDGRIDQFQKLIADSLQPIPHESMLTFVPEVGGLEFNPPRRSFKWNESVHREEFRLRAAATIDKTTAHGRLTVYCGAIILADVALAIRVDSAGPSAVVPPMSAVRASPYRKIFASYSRKDLDIVRQFERFAATFGDRYLRDLNDVRAGEEWSERLTELIRQADIVQLFWSWNSMTSPFVRREYEYALSLQRSNFVRPTYWEEPLPETPDGALPPEVLRRLHFQRIQLSDGDTTLAMPRERVKRTLPPQRRLEPLKPKPKPTANSSNKKDSDLSAIFPWPLLFFFPAIAAFFRWLWSLFQ